MFCSRLVFALLHSAFLFCLKNCDVFICAFVFGPVSLMQQIGCAVHHLPTALFSGMICLHFLYFFRLSIIGYVHCPYCSF